MQQQLGENAMNRRMDALSMSPAIYGLGYQPAQQLLGIGGMQQQQGQNVLNSYQNQFNQAQDWPFKTFDAMMAPFGRNIGGTQTQIGPGTNPIASGIGGALLGKQMGGLFGDLFGGGNFFGVGASPY